MAFGEIWIDSKTYAADYIILGSDNKAYQSLAADNLDHNPIDSPDWWKIYVRVLYLKNAQTGEIGKFANPQTGWVACSPAEITAEKLKNKKAEKVIELKKKLSDFVSSGCEYPPESEVFFAFNDAGITNLNLIDACSPTMPGRYTFCDINNVAIDFQDEAQFLEFKQYIFAEKDRVMKKFNGYKVSIRLCENIECVDDIVIDFSA